MKQVFIRALCLAACLCLIALPSFAEEAPEVRLTLLGHSTGIVLPDKIELDLAVSAGCDGVLTISWPIAGAPVFETPVVTGRNDLSLEIWEESMSAPDGDYTLTVTLRDAAETASDKKSIRISLQNDPKNAPPSVWDETPDTADAAEYRRYRLIDGGAEPPSHETSPGVAAKGETADNYWTLTMGDLSDEAAIWQAMMQPITILDDGKHTAKQTALLRSSPNADTKDNVIGEVTYKSQGVHVLSRTEDGWAQVEVYNTSYGDAFRRSRGKQGYGVTAEKLTGYLPSDILKEITPRDDYGLVIDKLNQTMYIFEKGKMTGTLLVSTGLNNSEQAWNETPAGEFLIASKTGGFWAGNLYCDMGLLLNNGCLIHEVPSVVYESGLHDYSTTEPRLGHKASHGCIRVQRKENKQGQNMKWLWNHLKTNTRVFVWDDATRYTEYPDDATVLYYNTVGGSRYHTTPNCSSVNKRYWPLAPFHYGELTFAPYNELTPCATCSAPKRPETIYKANLKNGFSD
ncbi:MAG: L,D-transpeptidase [Clostridia bacterium]|nr:L,D-transpeptidase [Clostridia bacterium]